jgi:hypothetical protein
VITAFWAGSASGAIATLSVTWLVSQTLTWVPLFFALGLVATVSVAGALRDLSVLRFRLPENRRLIPKRVLEKGPGRGAYYFGFELGTGLRTFLTSSAPYVVLASVLLLHPPLLSTIAAAFGFALGRTGPVIRASIDRRATSTAPKTNWKPALTAGCGLAFGLSVVIQVF